MVGFNKSHKRHQFHKLTANPVRTEYTLEMWDVTTLQHPNLTGANFHHTKLNLRGRPPKDTVVKSPFEPGRLLNAQFSSKLPQKRPISGWQLLSGGFFPAYAG